METIKLFGSQRVTVLYTALSTWSSWCPCWECCPQVERSDSVLLPPLLLSPAWVEGLWHPGMALLGNKLLLLLLDPINVLQGVTLLAGLCIDTGLITIIITLPPLITYLLNKTSAFLLAHPSPPPQNLEGQNPLQVSFKLSNMRNVHDDTQQIRSPKLFRSQASDQTATGVTGITNHYFCFT